MSRAQTMYDWIKARLEEGRTVYLSTVYKATKLKAKNLPQVRVRGAALEIQCGKRWIDYTWTKVTAE